MPCHIKFGVKNHFKYSFYSNASINKLSKRSMAFCQENYEYLDIFIVFLPASDTKDICHTTTQNQRFPCEVGVSWKSHSVIR